jgi:hypothetical protein
MPLSFTRTLRLKVRAEAYSWLNGAAVEVNEVFNYCNETSLKAATRTDSKRKWMSGFDLCNLTAGATQYFDKIGADTIQAICVHYAQKRQAARRLKLRWRVSRGARRSLGWVPYMDPPGLQRLSSWMAEGLRPYIRPCDGVSKAPRALMVFAHGTVPHLSNGYG